MMKKIVGILVILMLLIISSLSYIVPAKEVDSTIKSPEKCYNNINSDEYDYVVTFGPISSLLEVTEINWIDGDPVQIQEIEQLLDNKYSLNNIGFKHIECSNLSFSITYHWVFRFRPIYRWSFFTALVDEERFFFTYFLESFPYLGRNHTVTIEGFNGDLFVARFFRPIKLINPLAEFCFWGKFEEVTITK
jgi:hypothetical protein